jgi:hypothetical protein
MPLSADLQRAVQLTLASKRLGTPVFARYLFHLQGGAPVIMAGLARAVAGVRAWFDQPLERLYAQGSVKEQHINLTLEFRGAGSATVSWVGASRGGIDLMVLGNRGAIYHDVGSANSWDEVDAPEAAVADNELQALIERALRSGRPENAGDTP